MVSPLEGWSAVASKEGYAPVSIANVNPGEFGQALFEGPTALQPRKGIGAVEATAGAADVLLDISGDPAFTDAGDVRVAVVSGSGSVDNGSNALTGDGHIEAVYMGTDDFVVSIATSSNKILYTYVAEDADLMAAQAQIEPARTLLDLTAEAGQPVMVDVPPGGVHMAEVTLMVKQRPIEEALDVNAGSPLYMYEITAIDGSGQEVNHIRRSDTNNDNIPDTSTVLISRIDITLPIDLTVVGEGDLENGNARIYHADSVADLADPSSTSVIPVDQILATDYDGDGQVGSVTFSTDELSVFAVGAPRSGLADQTHDTTATGCFVNTIAQEDGMGSLLPAALIAALVLLAVFLARTWGRARRVTVASVILVACAFFLAGPADAMDLDGKLYVELNAMLAFEDIDVGETLSKFSEPLPAIDYEESSHGFQFALGYDRSESFSVKAVLEHVVSFDALRDVEFDAWDKIDTLFASLNVKLSYPRWERINPYLIAGVGALRARESILYIGGATSTTKDLGLGLRAGVGVDLSVTEKLSVGIEGLVSEGLMDLDHVKYSSISVGLGYHF